MWALGSIMGNKASGGDGIPAELFKLLKEGAIKVLHSICQQIWKIQQWPEDWKRSVFIPMNVNVIDIDNVSAWKAMSKNVQTTIQWHSFHILSKIMLKILQARLEQYVNWELLYV